MRDKNPKSAKGILAEKVVGFPEIAKEAAVR